MNFFKSVLSEPSPPSSPTSSDHEEPPISSWAFGSNLLKSVASKSESLLGNYYKDLQDFTSGLKEETSVIREAATRALRDLPSHLDSGAVIAQESLEAVGQSIDTVAEFIGKELKLVAGDGDSTEIESSDPGLGVIGRPYSRLEAVIRGLQGDLSTYCDETEDSGFGDWKLGFRIEGKREEIERLIMENRGIREIHDEIVPVRIDDHTFWCRYFYRVEMAVKAEEARAKMVKRAISGDEDEDFSWDVEDDDDNATEIRAEPKGKEVANSEVELERDKGESQENRSSSSEKEGSEGKLGSDISIVSSQRTSHAEDDMGWDEIERVPSGDESKPGSSVVATASSDNVSDLRKRLSSNSADEDEELTWEIDDGDDEDHAK